MSECVQAVLRHLGADWGNVPARQKDENDRHFAAQSGQLISAYETNAGESFLVVTESDWTCTVILYVDEFQEYQEARASRQAVTQGIQ